MATEFMFEPSTPLINTEADGTLAPAGLATAQANLVIASRHEIIAAGIETVLQTAGHRVAARCSCEDELVRSLDDYRPDIIMLVENIVLADATRTVSRVRARNRTVAMIFVLGEHDPITASDLLDLDVEGILLNGAGARSLIDCVRSVHHGRKWMDPNLLRRFAIAERPCQMSNSLTSREADIAHLVSRGLHNKQIARELKLSEGTVKMHLHHIYRKLRVGGRTQLALSITSVCSR